MPVLTARNIQAIKSAPPGKRSMLWDAALPSFGVRVTDKGSCTFLVMRRLDGKLVRRSIGRPWKVGGEPKISLAQARAEAREAIAKMGEGLDPNELRAAAKAAEQRTAEVTFSAVAEDFIARHVTRLRTGAEVAAALRSKLVAAWGDQPVTAITRSDIIRLVRREAEVHPYAAHHTLAYARKLFGWAVAQDAYGLAGSPCLGIVADDLVGKREGRQRVLAEEEIRRVWFAAGRAGYPFGPLVRLLLITGQRLRECGEADWSEFDLEKSLWSIWPAAGSVDTALG